MGWGGRRYRVGCAACGPSPLAGRSSASYATSYTLPAGAELLLSEVMRRHP